MNIFESQFKKILLLVPLLFFISSCEPGCVEADEFDTEQTIVNARPTSDGIIGKYSAKSGGQVANWHDTGLRSNGDPIKILIGGGWSAWDQVSSQKDLNNLSECKLCLKKDGIDNCICHNGQKPEIEQGTDKKPIKIDDKKGGKRDPDCSSGSPDQLNPGYCTCTDVPNKNGNIVGNDTAIDRIHYIIALDYQNKDGSLKIPDEQQPCKYNKGLGLYIGLFGTTGIMSPSRAYHLYSNYVDNQGVIQEICDIMRNAKGECVDANGTSRSKYLYIPPNNKIFMKDDLAGNNGVDTDPSDDQYHKAKEKIKVIIYDRYYDDNFGYYTLDFISGVQRAKDRGLLEYIVGSVEDVLLGQVNTDSGRREGGIIEFIYKALVQDSTIILIIRLCLILYITIFGIGVLAGVVEISRKEVMNRVMKLSLVMFFTIGTSWYWYDHIVIGFFKDSMDYIISIFMSLSEKIYGDDTSMIKITQMLREESTSNATRFSYVDQVMKKLFSIAVTKKIWGLFFSSLFGLLYIVVIYFLIGYFVYVAATAALIYISAMLKLVFIIALGPIFILSSLFNQTSVMFKKWLSFLGARSLEIILLFATFYLFLVMIDKGFMDLLSFRSCGDKLVIGFFSIDTLKAEVDRSFVGWIIAFINLGLLIFLLQTIMSKIAGVSNHLLTISGTASKSGIDAFSISNNSAIGMARNIMGEALSNGISAAKMGLSGVGMAVRALGAGKALEAIGDSIPFRGPRGWMRDSIIDKSIESATIEARNKGFTGAAMEQHVRQAVTADLAKKGLEDSTKFAMLGVNQKTIEKKLDQKFVQEPLRKFIKSEAAKLKKEGKPLFGKDMTDEIKNRARQWAAKSLYDKSSIEDHLRNMKSFMKEQGTYSADEAARKFSGNADHRNKYLEHLEGNILKNKTKYNNKIFGGLVRGYRDLLGGDVHNPKKNQEQFLRKEYYKKEQDKEGRGALAKLLGINTTKGWNPIKRIDLLDRKINRQQLEKNTKEKVERARVRAEFLQPGYGKKLESLNNKYNAQKAEVEKEKKANQDKYEAEKIKINNKQSIYSLDEIEKARKQREDGLAVKLNNIENAQKKEKDKLDSKPSFEKEIINIEKRYKAEKARLAKGESPYTLAEIEKMREKEEKRWAEKIKDYSGDLSLAENKGDLAVSDQAKDKAKVQGSINDSISGNGLDNAINPKVNLDNIIEGFVEGKKTVEDVKAAVIGFNNKQKASVPDIQEALNKLEFKLRHNKARLEELENKRDKKSAIEEQEILDLKAQIDRDETRLSVETVKLEVVKNQQEE